MCNGARTQSFRTRSSRSERRAHLCERIYTQTGHISKTKADIKKKTQSKKCLEFDFPLENIKKSNKKQKFWGRKILVENFSKFFFPHIKGNFFFQFFHLFCILNVVLHLLYHFGTKQKKNWAHKNRPWGGGLCKSVSRTQPLNA